MFATPLTLSKLLGGVIVWMVLTNSSIAAEPQKKPAEASQRPAQGKQEPAGYTTYSDFRQVIEAQDARYPAMVRVSDPGTPEHPIYTGFFFYQCPQFDATRRYLLGMRVDFDKRAIKPDDRAEIGVIDLKNHSHWTKIGETTAWNWQQGARLQWRPQCDEIVWNDRSDDGRSFVCRVYNFRTEKRRTLPKPIYDLSPDGRTALTHVFEGDHQGTDYAPLISHGDKQEPPGIWKMDLDSGRAELIMPLDKMAAIAFHRGVPKSNRFYIFREGWNPSGSRFIAFVKDPENKLYEAYSMSADGADVRYLYRNPSHHAWLDEEYIFDFGLHKPPGSDKAIRGYFLFKDDGSGIAKELLWPVNVDDGWGGDGHGSCVPGAHGNWIISDTYNIHGFQYLFLFHRPTKRFVPLAKLKCTRPNDEYRVDTHPRLSRDGRLVSIDATYEGLGRQMYVLDMGYILDDPPVLASSAKDQKSGLRVQAKQPDFVAPDYDDYQNMLDQVGIKKVRRGRDARVKDTSDEATANPYKDTMPELLTFKDGTKVKTGADWHKRRAEIIEDFEREVYGWVPKNVPKVTWEVTGIKEGDVPQGTRGGMGTVTKTLVGHVDNSAFPKISVAIQASFYRAPKCGGQSADHSAIRLWICWKGGTP